MATRARVLLAVLASVLLVAAMAGPVAAHDGSHPNDHIFQPGVTWNGYRIYLSPAHHWVGDKFGCDGYSEHTNMHALAHESAILGAGTFSSRGYKVRVGHGDPDDAVYRSNIWPADRHISLHSNAHGGSTGCGFSNGGTVVFYYPGSSVGSNLATNLKNALDESSPGTNDYTATHTLYELANTTAPAAYVETEFHDWVTGKNWLVDYQGWAWRIGWAVDVHLDYP